MRRRDAVDDGVEQFGDARCPSCALHLEHFVGIDGQRLLHLDQHFVGPGVWQVDLVDDRHDRQVGVHRGEGVGHRLGLDALGRIDQQERPFAAGQRARDFVVKIDVAGRVDQVQLVLLAVVLVVHRDGAGLDRDAALPLQVHVVEQLVLHLALG